MAPRPDLLHPDAAAILNDWPAVVRGEPDFVALAHCIARESERVLSGERRLRSNLFPQTADELGLPWHEDRLGVIPPPNATVAQRRARVFAAEAAAAGGGTGAEWEDALRRVIGAGGTYREHVPGDAESPPPYNVWVFLPAGQTVADTESMQRDLETFVDANTRLVIRTDTAGFLLDRSQLDADDMR